MNNIDKEIVFLSKLLRIHYPGPNGLLPQLIDAKSGLIVKRRAITDEFGDYLPYIYYAAQKDNDEKAKQWCIEHVRESVRLTQSAVGLFDAHQSIDAEFPRKNRMIYSIHNADTINGLVAMYLLSKDVVLKEAIEKFFNGIKNNFLKKGLISYGIHEKKWRYFPLANALASAYITEELITFSLQTGNKGYFTLADNILKKYWNDTYFKRYKFFPIRKYTTWLARLIFEPLFYFEKKPSSSSSVMVKDNVYLIFSLLASYEVTKNEETKKIIETWIDRFLSVCYTETGKSYNEWSPSKGVRKIAGLQHSHSIVELFIDAYRVFGNERYLEVAKQITAYWLTEQGKTGLIREKEKNDKALLDPQVDFAVNLMKLGEITGDKNYTEKGKALMDAVIRYFKLPYGYAWSVNTKNGSVIGKNIETKFLGLLLKGLIVYSEVSSEKKIFSDPLLINISRDR